MPSESTWLGRSFPPWQIYPSLFLHKVGERVFFALVCMVADCILMRPVSKSRAIEKSRTLAVVQPTPDEVAEQVAQALQDNQGDTGGTITNYIGGGASEKRRRLARASASQVSSGCCSVLSSTACLTSAFRLLGFWTLSSELVARKGDAGEGGDGMMIALHDPKPLKISKFEESIFSLMRNDIGNHKDEKCKD